MKLFICAVRDRKVEAYMTPFFVSHIGQAKRSFADEVNSSPDKSVLAKHPEDYDLYHLGEYDDSDASFVTSTPRLLSVGLDCTTK